MNMHSMGWDVGGAHLKRAGLDQAGQLHVAQEPCPLWLGTERLESALARIMAGQGRAPGCRHVVTMTGELADCFSGRKAGVATLARLMTQWLAPEPVAFFAGSRRLLTTPDQAAQCWEQVASANWLATAHWTARSLPDALLVDIGSTTTDLIVIQDGLIQTRGYSDAERMRYDELLYTGVVRTPLMALATRVPHDGEWLPVMAEQFATTADVYRLTGELPTLADQQPSADGGDKTLTGSARRLARMLGLEAESFSLAYWQTHARIWRERQLERLMASLMRQLSRGCLKPGTPLVGVGVGRFLVRECALRLCHPYRDIDEFFPPCYSAPACSAADCAPAAALACLAARNGFFDDDPN